MVPMDDFLKDRALPAAAYFLVALALMLPLLGPGYYLALDLPYGPEMFSDSKFTELYGGSSANGGYLPLHLVLASLSSFFPPELMEKAILLSVFFLCGFAMHASLPKELGGARYFAGFSYMLSPFVFIRFFVGHWHFLISYAMWPLCMALFLDFIRKPEAGRAAKAALATFVAAISSHGVFMLLACYAAMSVFALMSAGRKAAPGLAARMAAPAAAVLAMALFWIVPTVALFGQTYHALPAADYLADFGARGTADSPLPLAVLAQYGFWRTDIMDTRDAFSLWLPLFMLILSISITGLICMFRQGERLLAASLCAVFAAGFFLSMGSSGPFSWVFDLGWGAMQLGFLFRDSQKFVGLISLAYAVTGAYGVFYLAEGRSGRARLAILLCASALPFIYDSGFFGFLGQIGPTQYPPDWHAAERMMAADPVPGGVLVLPAHLYRVFDWANSTQKTLGSPMGQFFSRPVVTANILETAHVYADRADPVTAHILYMFENRQHVNNTAEMLLPLNARYVMLFKDDVDSPHYLYLFKRAGGVANITQVLESPKFYLFRNDIATGPVFASGDGGSGGAGELAAPGRQRSYAPIQYEEVTPASYRIVSAPASGYVVLAMTDYGTPLGQFTLDGEAGQPWYGLGVAYPARSPAWLSNQLFYVTIALLALSWAVALVLLSGPGMHGAVLALAAGAIIWWGGAAGALGPAGIGHVIVLSAALALWLRKYGPGSLRKHF